MIEYTNKRLIQYNRYNDDKRKMKAVNEISIPVVKTAREAPVDPYTV
jgi:hypothetical protein